MHSLFSGGRRRLCATAPTGLSTAFGTLEVYGDTDHAALRLITCGGFLERATGHDVDNVVAFTRLTGVRHS